MQTFFEFLHGDGWKKPLLPANNNAVTARIIRSGQQGNTRSDLGTFPDGQTNAWHSTTKMPSHQRLMLILSGAGPQGMTHADIASMLNLDAKVLDDLLDALARAGEIAVSQTKDGRRVYRRLI